MPAKAGAVYVGEYKSQKITHVRIDEVQQGGIVKGNDITGEEKKGNDDYWHNARRVES